MARIYSLLSSHLSTILIVLSVLAPLVQSQDNRTFVEQPEYTTFELFKNTGLQPCPINYTTVPADIILPREPRRGGGGGGGGTRGGGTVNPLFASTWIGKNHQDYCKHMTGIPVMIPTVPTQNAFTPWWPTFTMQFVSLLFTWVGLWWTTRSIEKDPDAQDMSLPITFWIQLPIDIGGIVAWFVRTLQGFAEARQFSWVSVILWLVPFNYIWLTRLIGTKKEDEASNIQSNTGQPYRVAPTEEQGYRGYEEYRESGVETKFLGFRNISINSLTPPRSKFRWVSVMFMVITAMQWCLSLVVVGLHFKYSWINKRNHPTYIEAPRAISNPSSIANMPQSCLNWLQQSSSLVASELLDMNIVQVLFCIIHAFQFVVCTGVVIFSSRSRYHILGKLKISATASLLSLGLPALGTGMWILGKVVFGDQDTWITYTRNLTTTGGCTFAAVTMDRQWGYWDVQYNFPVRVGMSALGVA